MRHLKKGRKFGRERDIRKALMKSLASSFFMAGRIETTEAKAKELRPMVEKIITRAKKETLANRRILGKLFSDKTTAHIFTHARAFGNRNGGYTRIIKTARRRRDDARRAIIELVK
ncbi:MAG: large subunit ribosomal protein L17 [Parcubacteria group bacterium Gr01-1014_33]|nr:MAG: large subunit ribosomal protein L17 [Parcubacteria group bacterium Gr01-1014_33]